MGTALSVIMYISYVPQIMGNLHGHKTFFLQPLAAAVNCSIWTAYGLLKEKRDYPLSAANFPGVVFGLLATITAF
ncbi:SemiSWEET family transporter [Lachnoanaerobaculum orale]|uniref:SemiSWEET family transporter n=1 Tax=Lachnoanaerobaculum orale TaxID=979627 RepID=UPI002ED629B1